MMGSWSGNSWLSNNRFLNSGSEEELQLEMLKRKRKRMESNRESARRSRMRQRQHMDDMVAQVVDLRKENSELVVAINMTTHLYQNVETQNSILRAQIDELSQRLQSLNHILNLVINTRTTLPITTDEAMNLVVNPMNMFLYHNQPIMACADTFLQCEFV